MTQTINFTVTGEDKIHCAACEQRIAHALRRLPGVKNVLASAKTQDVAVTIDPGRLGPDQVKARLQEIGYEVTPWGGGG
jgi:copper chaperone CopZ